MRQRKIKNLDEKLSALSAFTVENGKELRGEWRSIFGGGDTPLYAEFGCGKGKFIAGMAAAHPEKAYVAFEGNMSVVYHAMQKAEASGLGNVKFIPYYIDLAGEYFADGELDGIYMNFSDPWPKVKHEKRRLTAGKRLDEYIRIVRQGGSIEFRTDNDDLFDYTMEKLTYQSGIKIAAVTRDLHGETAETAYRADLAELTECGFEDEKLDSLTTLEDLRITSEYEDKFSESGKNINYVKVLVL